MKTSQHFLWVSVLLLIMMQCEAQHRGLANSGGAMSFYQVRGHAACGTNFFAATAGEGVQESTDAGQSWVPVNAGLANLNIWSIVAHGSVLFAGTVGGGLYRSTDEGISWTRADTGITNTYVTALGVTGTLVFAGTWGGLYVSSNEGNSWTKVGNGLGGQINGFSMMDSLLFAATDDGIYRSSDNGTSWNRLYRISMQSVLAVGKDLYVGTWGYGAMRSTDAGNSWSKADSGLYAVYGASYIQSLVQSGDNLLAGTMYTGIYLSTDQGLHWRCTDTTMAGHVGYANLFSGINGLVLAGTSLGHHRSTDDGLTWSAVINSIDPSARVLASGFVLDQNYPNPFNPSTTIRYGLPQRSQVTLTIFNTLGQQVATLVQEEKQAGYHEVKFDGSGQSSGVYFYRMTAGDYVATKKLLVLR